MAVVAILTPSLAASARSQPSRPAASEEEFRARANALIKEMTPEEKAAQLAILFALPPMQSLVDKRAANGGGAFLFVTDPKETNRLQHLALEKSRLKIPLLFGFDVIHGLRTIFPVPIGMAASWDPAMVERSQSVAASEARAVGVHWTFGPMVDIARDARWGRLVEGAGEDPYLGSAMAAAQVRGFQGSFIGSPGHIVAGAKHFAAYGAAAGGRDYDEVAVSEADLRNVHLPPFKAAVDAGAGNIMSAYMPLNGIPATANHWLLTDILRKEWGFQGWVVSDNEGVNNLKTHGVSQSAEESAAKAISAGLDMEMALFNPAMNSLPKAIADGKISEEQVDGAVRRVLETKMRLGLFDDPYVDEARAELVLSDPRHLDAARIAAERSAVLLKNEGGLLPLDVSKLRSVAVIGSLANSSRDTLGPWVFPQNKPVAQSILTGLKARLGAKVTVSYAPGVAIPPRVNPSPFKEIEGAFDEMLGSRPAPADDERGIAEAVRTAEAADVAIVVVGEASDQIGETASRSSLDLPGRQQELLDAVVATGKPTIVLLMNGRPLDLKDTRAGAILDIWYPGSAGAAATANLLFGDAVPGGKLPFLWPRSASQLPMFYAHTTSHDPKNAYKRYWNESNAPVYPFGHGISYTTFSYSNLAVDRQHIRAGDTVTVSVDVRNTGSRSGDEVAQLYLHQQSGTAARPVRELKGFQRLTLKAGETRKISFKIGPAELRYWNAAVRGWVIDDAIFDVAVGTDSTAPLQSSFEVSAGSGGKP
ncbi:beta-glucosidase [Novosphingobium endophyticum]|uniref:Beta-D-glucoside glucohydrolase n=1 Tax=Novosphingobium endophyticum TaxID=1955250 RepID=A0A916X3R2_9SPHN|nr:beta-glucosidase BglX [Novosphingobium endophyticum]GGB85820.1 beta-glucosidase [Novosphingobium endophyticum]